MQSILNALQGVNPNRMAIYLTALAGLATAIAPAVAGMDTSSTAGVIAGFLGIAATVDRFLKGWQAHEARVARGFEIEDPRVYDHVEE